MSVCLRGEAPTFQELMDPGVFPNPMRGMEVKSAELTETKLKVETTGARLEWDLAKGTIEFSQLLVKERKVLEVQLKPAAAQATMTHNTQGFVLVRFDSPRLDLRVNGDSFFLFYAREPVELVLKRAIYPVFHGGYKSHHLILDYYGGFGMYCSDNHLPHTFDRFSDKQTAVYTLPADTVLCIGINPPKSYDWKQSLKDQFVWHWLMETSYPPEEILELWAQHANIFGLFGRIYG